MSVWYGLLVNMVNTTDGTESSNSEVTNQLTNVLSASSAILSCSRPDDTSHVVYVYVYTYFSAILWSVFSEAFMSSSDNPTSRPLSSTPIWYTASPLPSWRRHFICVARCSKRYCVGFTSFNCTSTQQHYNTTTINLELCNEFYCATFTPFTWTALLTF